MSDNSKLEKKIISLAEKLKTAKAEIHKVIYGQEDVTELCIASILSGGHFLLIGLPGLGKTKIVETIGAVMGLDNGRIQYTPDLMPADILGSEVLRGDDKHRNFEFIKGPIFCQLLMADEINRASPRTQSALLQAMQEYHVTVGGKRYDLPKPFHVMATQNPLEQEGTYPLPEAQLDRFIMQIDVEYPSAEDEYKMMVATTGNEEVKIEKILSAKEIIEAQEIVRELPVGEKVAKAILQLVQSCRPDQSEIDMVRQHVSWGPGPRASQALMLTSRAKALLEGRYSPSIDDVIELAPSILRHRMDLRFSARAEGLIVDDIIKEACEQLDN